MTKGLVISAASSGAGKTTLMLGLLRAYRDRGLAVQPYKCGPDYIDPAFHLAASGRESLNLDSWAMPAGMIAGLAGRKADLVLAEGAMGLFDGVALPGACGNGASADIAGLMGWPVVLVIDVGGQAQTAAAVAHGLATFRPGVQVAGVILNRVASARHDFLVRVGMEERGISVFGALAKQAAIAVPERHLGLVQAQENAGLETIIAQAGALVAAGVDLNALMDAAGTGSNKAKSAYSLTPPGQRIALARDAAFSFVYPHMLSAWRAAGAEILPFSPLNNEGPDSNADCCWLPGGYPELHAGVIAGAGHFLATLRRFAETRPVHGECGGYMVMGAGLVDKDGTRHAMAGLLGLETSYAMRKMHLGYRHATLLTDGAGQNAGTALRGHEFHYSTITAQPDAPLAVVTDATGSNMAETGSFRRQSGGGLSTGTFFHLIAADAA
jgi:cobyrinic acid a,c-diamide synthase